MDANSCLDTPALFSRLVEGPDPLFFVGAGASVSSGIPTSGDLVRLGVRWLYATNQGWAPDDPRIRPGDVARMLEGRSWYAPGADLADHFPDLIRELDRPRELRRRFLLHLLQDGGPPKAGYECLSSLMRDRVIHSVLTTNFDDLIRTAYGPGPLITIAKPDEYVAITTAPAYPQVIHLHGQAEYYMDRNLPNETEHLDELLVERLIPLLRDHPIVVVGYRGAERSVMHDLLINNISLANGFNHGIYWCVRGESADLAPLAADLAEQLGPNFVRVRISDFDQLLLDFRKYCSEQGRGGVFSSSYPTGAPLSFDLKMPRMALGLPPVSELPREFTTYASRLHQPDGANATAGVERLLITTGLAVQGESGLAMTNAGALLLSADPRDASRGAWLELCLPGRPPRAIDGNLWTQFGEAMAVLSDANRPMRIKGPRSETSRRYPLDAIKEIVANALVHRDYERSEPTIVTVAANEISVESPGGIEPSLLRRLVGEDYAQEGKLLPADVLQRRIDRGDRGAAVSGYRNPVIADLFFGSGLIDKVGSGLADTLSSMEETGGRLVVEVLGDNSRFTARLLARPVQVERRTGTARPIDDSVQAHTNVFEVIDLPKSVWSASSPIRDRRDVIVPTGEPIPVFVPYDGCIYTFSILPEEGGCLTAVVDSTSIREHRISDLEMTTDGVNRLTDLLNQLLLGKLSGAGLRVDWRRKRAYFPCKWSSARYVRYKARVNNVKRRVAWWPGVKKSYCVHRAAEFHFERIQSTWCLRVTPTYVFTLDGDRERLTGPEGIGLATRHSTEDYNQKVLADVFFWRSMIADDDGVVRLPAGLGEAVVIADKPICTTMPSVDKSSYAGDLGQE